MKKVLLGASGLLLSFALVSPAFGQTASTTATSTVTFDATTTNQLVQVISATRTLLNTIQAQFAAGMYTTQQRFAIASTLNSIGIITGNISSRIGGNSSLAAVPVAPGFPNTGEPSEAKGFLAGVAMLALGGAYLALRAGSLLRNRGI